MSLPIQSWYRSPRGAALAALAVGCSSIALAATAAPAARVAAVEATRVADLVMLDGGFNASLRQGMVCRIVRGTADVAEVLVVEVRPNCCAALILSVAPKQSIRAGDLAAVKVHKV